MKTAKQQAYASAPDKHIVGFRASDSEGGDGGSKQAKNDPTVPPIREPLTVSNHLIGFRAVRIGDSLVFERSGGVAVCGTESGMRQWIAEHRLNGNWRLSPVGYRELFGIVHESHFPCFLDDSAHERFLSSKQEELHLLPESNSVNVANGVRVYASADTERASLFARLSQKGLLGIFLLESENSRQETKFKLVPPRLREKEELEKLNGVWAFDDEGNPVCCGENPDVNSPQHYMTVSMRGRGNADVIRRGRPNAG